MSLLSMSDLEKKEIDKKVETMLDWASTRTHEAEQLAMDSARLLSCTGERLDKVAKQGFFKRCWARFSGDAAADERANTKDIIQIQKTSLRYINILQEQQLMMAHSMLVMKNNLFSLAVKEEETRMLLELLAQRTLERFEKLEHRVDQLEISTNLQGWLLSLEERDYDEKFPTENMRLFRVINDFYSLKNDDWNYNDLMFMRKAIRTVQINPKRKISLNVFIDDLIDEIESSEVGVAKFGDMITAFAPNTVKNYHKFSIDNISSPVFTAIHTLPIYYEDRRDMIEEFQEELNISASEALKRLLKRTVKQQNVNLDYEFPLAETAIEILGCLRLAEKLALPQEEIATEESLAPTETAEEISTSEAALATKEEVEAPQKVDASNFTLGTWKTMKHPKVKMISDIIHADGKFWCFGVEDGNSEEHVSERTVAAGNGSLALSAGAALLGGVLVGAAMMGASRRRKSSGTLNYSSSNSLSVFSSVDLQEWDKVTSITIDSSFSSTLSCVCYKNNCLIIIDGSNLYISNNFKSFECFALRDEISDENISYVGVHHDGEQWYIIGTYDVSYTYKKKGIFNDSNDEYSYTTYVVFYGKDLNNLREYQFTTDFKQYETASYPAKIAFCGKNLATMLQYSTASSDDEHEDTLLVTSKNGYTWKSISIADEDKHFRNIVSFNENFFVEENENVYKFNASTGKLSKHCKLNNKNFNYIKIFNGHGIVFYSYEYEKDEFYISNDLKKWTKIDRPHKFNRNFTYGGGYLVTWDNDEITYRELR